MPIGTFGIRVAPGFRVGSDLEPGRSTQRRDVVRRSRLHVLLAALLAIAAPAPTLAAMPLYEVTDLGTFFPTGVNDDAWIAGYDGRALLWRPGIGLTDLGSFGGPGGAVSNRANALNAAGQVVGYTWSTIFGAYRAFQWEEGIGLVDLGDLPAGANDSRADAINAVGVAAGRAGGNFSSHPTWGNLSFNHAVRFDAPEVLVDLEQHADTTLNSIVRGINDAGATAGERQTSAGWRAIHWATDGTPTNLGLLWDVQGQGVHSYARDINNLGQVALELPLGISESTAAIWEAGAGFTEIGRLDGATTAAARAINDAGTVVGSSGGRGMAWTAEDGLVDLNDQLDPVLAAGWQIADATAISEGGLIVGRGFHPSLGNRAILMTPVPEPAASLLLASGLGVLLLLQQRRTLPARHQPAHRGAFTRRAG